MTGAAWAVVVLAMAVLVVASAAAVALNPGAFFYELGKLAWADLWPKLLPIITKRMTGEQEKAWRACMRQGGRWDSLSKRCDKFR